MMPASPPLLFLPDRDGLRMDAWLAECLSDRSRTFVQRLIADGRVTLSGRAVRAGERTRVGTPVHVDMPPPEPVDAIPQDIPLRILHEDDWLLVLDKPRGLVVHPAPGHPDGTLVNALLAHCGNRLSDANGGLRPGIVHRIDKDTSGLLLVVKDNRIHDALARQIARHEVVRRYLALVHGTIREDTARIEAPIGRHPVHRKKMAVVAAGRPAVTRIRVLDRFRASTEIEAELETGRTHQIRVHMAYIGHPVIGDPLYGPAGADGRFRGQLLHAFRLDFVHPATQKPMHFETPPPPEYLAAREVLSA